MRSDMSKVIVERPRRRRPTRGAGSEYPRGRLKNGWWPSLEEAPNKESMGGHYAEKWLNENLRPLVRFLRSSVGRPWSKVHAEIAAHLSCGNAVQKHVLDHLRDYVHEHVRVEGKVVVAFEGPAWRHHHVLQSVGMQWRFYVCPRTGLLRLAPTVARKRRSAGPDPDRRVLSRARELRRIKGVWFEITTAAIPADGAPACFDVVARELLPDVQGRGHDDPLWESGRYAAAKRQLGGRELARLGLGRLP